MCMTVGLLFASFFAGVLMFLAPCTLPLVPGFLGFISGDLTSGSDSKRKKKSIVKNAVFYIFGFSIVFILLGTVFSAGGLFLGHRREIISRIGGLFVIVFGLHMTGIITIPNISFVNKERRYNLNRFLHPGNTISSFLFGATFAFGWTPCIGPILGTILLLASRAGTMMQGGLLLVVFSLGLAVPYLFIAFSYERAMTRINRIQPHLHRIQQVGGVFLILIGVLLVLNNFAQWQRFFYTVFDFLQYETLLEYL